MSDTKWWPAADAVRPYMEELMRDCGELVGHAMVHIEFHFTADPPKVSGREAAAVCRKVSKRTAYLTMDREDQQRFAPDGDVASEGKAPATPVEPFFMIEISWMHWTMPPLGVDADRYRRALLHHELMHIDPIDRRLIPHAIEAFHQTIARFGLWNYSLEKMGQAATLGTAAVADTE